MPSRGAALLAATGTTLSGLHGIGPSGAARLLAEVGEVTWFPTKAHFASWNGTAPIDASSGDQVRHRLSRGGNRQPLPYWGWGDIPDQYRRQWDSDDGDSPQPTAPGVTDLPPLRPHWGR